MRLSNEDFDDIVRGIADAVTATVTPRIWAATDPLIARVAALEAQRLYAALIASGHIVESCGDWVKVHPEDSFTHCLASLMSQHVSDLAILAREPERDD